ncbi:MAG: iron-containing alcohol dehydrogenase, partial [Actinomycetia bacterium]|nr:iron-containing alcohol dehydrogenase [Actinomycetes bacterium]
MTVLPPGRFQNWHQWQQVVHGHDALGQLAGELERLGAARVLIVTTPSVASSPVLALVEAALGPATVGVYASCRRGAPRPSVLAAAEAAASASADVLVSVGGGSVVDTAKGAALCGAAGITTAEGFDGYRVGAQAAGFDSPQLADRPLPVVALPTTLSGAEYTGMIGITDLVTDYRDPYRFDVLAPVTVVLDPRLTTATPDRLWAGTGIKSLSDAFEQYVAGAAGPALEPQLLRAVAWLARWLPPSLDGDLDARLRCQVASWLTMFGTFNAASRVGIGAALRHQLGMVHGIPHGEASCPVLAEVARRTTPDGEAGAALLAATSVLGDGAGGSPADVVASRF